MTPKFGTPKFGTDGLRGVAGIDLTDGLVFALGRAVAQVLGTDISYLVARDTRESGAALETIFALGLETEGASVMSAGVLPTPGLAYLAQQRGSGAAMISASHNPYRDNGVKVFAVGGRKLSDATERAIETALEDLLYNEHVREAAPGLTLDVLPGALEKYVDHLTNAFGGRVLGGLKVVLDCGHGAAFEAAPRAFRRMGAEVIVLNASPDGRNINQDCGSTNIDSLRREVLANGAAVGFAFDGDADRCIAVDECGQTVDGDHMLALIALDLQSRGELAQNSVVITVMGNLGLRHALASADITMVETTVGDRYVLEAMEAQGLSLGGEQSGHIIISEFATTGDGTLSALYIADLMARSSVVLSELTGVVAKVPQLLRNVRVKNREGLDDAEGFWNEVTQVEGLLGVHGRVLVRASGTEPVVRIMVEAATESLAQGCVDRLEGALVGALGSPAP